MATEPTIATGEMIDGPPRKRLRTSWITIDEGDFLALQQIFHFRVLLETLLEPRNDSFPTVEIGDDSTGNRVTKFRFVEELYDLFDDACELAAPHIAKLDALEVLHFDSNLITTCSDAEWLGRMTRLKELTWECGNEEISYPPRVIERLPKLEKLEIMSFDACHSSYEEEDFSFIFDLKTLKELILDSVDELPDKMQKMNNLKILRLKNISSAATPSVVWNLRNLESLHIGGFDSNMIIPDDIVRLTSLNELELYGACQLSSLIGNLPNLKALHVSKKSIKSLAQTTLTRPSNDVNRFQKLEYVNILQGYGAYLRAYSQELVILQTMPNLRALRFSDETFVDEHSYRILLDLPKHCPFLGYIAGLDFTNSLRPIVGLAGSGNFQKHKSFLENLRENRTRWVFHQLKTLVGGREIPVTLWPILLVRACKVLPSSYAKFVASEDNTTPEELQDVSESDVIFRLLTQKAANDRLRSE